MNKKMKKLAMKAMLSQKLKEGNIVLFDDLFLESHKTKPWKLFLSQNHDIGKKGKSALIVDHYSDVVEENEEKPQHVSHMGVPINLLVASGSVARVKVVNPGFCNVLEVIRREKLVLTLSSLKALEDRLTV